MNFRGLFSMFRRGISLVLVMSFVVDLSSAFLINAILFTPKVAEAAQVVIEASPNTTGSSHTQSGSSVVFISDLVGYKFFRPGSAPDSGMCVYRKTTDGGATWGARVRVDTQTDCIGVSVWYDQWTPGDTGTYIHIATIDTTDDDLFYNRLDTSNDSLLLVTATSTARGTASILAAGTNESSITKATDGRIIMVTDDANLTLLRSCTTNCGVGSNWSAMGTAPQGNADSWSLLMPLASGNVMLINKAIYNTEYSSFLLEFFLSNQDL